MKLSRFCVLLLALWFTSLSDAGEPPHPPGWFPKPPGWLDVKPSPKPSPKAIAVERKDEDSKGCVKCATGERAISSVAALSNASITLHVPDDAQLYLNDQLMPASGSTRRFSIPRFYDNRHYKIRVECMGKRLTTTQSLQPDQSYELDLRQHFDGESGYTSSWGSSMSTFQIPMNVSMPMRGGGSCGPGG